MKKTTKRKLAETAVGAAVGGAIAGPIGAVAGGLVAGHVEEGLDFVAKEKPPVDYKTSVADDPQIHVWPGRILVPLDFSPPSRRAMRFARHWADYFSARVWLLHVLEPSTVGGELGKAAVGRVQRGIPQKAKAALRNLAGEEFPIPDRVSVVVRKGKPADEINTAARLIRADLIIIATHGRTGLKHMLLGSTAESVARQAPCPVLILRRRPKAARQKSNPGKEP